LRRWSRLSCWTRQRETRASCRRQSAWGRCDPWHVTPGQPP